MSPPILLGWEMSLGNREQEARWDLIGSHSLELVLESFFLLFPWDSSVLIWDGVPHNGPVKAWLAILSMSCRRVLSMPLSEQTLLSGGTVGLHSPIASAVTSEVFKGRKHNCGMNEVIGNVFSLRMHEVSSYRKCQAYLQLFILICRAQSTPYLLLLNPLWLVNQQVMTEDSFNLRTRWEGSNGLCLLGEVY